MVEPLVPLNNTVSVKQVLLAGRDVATLHQALRNGLPDLDFHLCASFDEIERTLPHSHTVIANTRLFQGHASSLITLMQSVQPAAPLILTVRASETAAAVRALERGVFDCITNPVRAAQAVRTVQRALWLYQLRTTIARRKQLLEHFQQQRTAILARDRLLSQERTRAMAQEAKAMEDTLAACEATITAIETSLRYLTETTSGLRAQAWQQAFHRLTTL